MNNPKAVAISEFNSLQFTDAGQKIMTLLDIMLYDYRVDNDTASVESFRVNQGRIDTVLQLKAYLERGR